MTVSDLIAMLGEFPPGLPVFVTADGRSAFAPADAVMNLTHPRRGEVMAFDGDSGEVPEGFIDSLVIYPQPVRD